MLFLIPLAAPVAMPFMAKIGALLTGAQVGASLGGLFKKSKFRWKQPPIRPEFMDYFYRHRKRMDDPVLGNSSRIAAQVALAHLGKLQGGWQPPPTFSGHTAYKGSEPAGFNLEEILRKLSAPSMRDIAPQFQQPGRRPLLDLLGQLGGGGGGRPWAI